MFIFGWTILLLELRSSLLPSYILEVSNGLSRQHETVTEAGGVVVTGFKIMMGNRYHETQCTGNASTKGLVHGHHNASTRLAGKRWRYRMSG